MAKPVENPVIKTRFEVKNEVSEKAEMYLYGTIRKAQWYEDESSVISSSRVMAELKELKGKNIDVHINSGGGDVFESIAIGNLLQQHDGDIDIYIDGLAGSGASVIAMAGKNIYMFDNSMMMIHKAWTIAVGNSTDLRKTASDLDKMDDAVRASYMGKFIGSEEELKVLIDDETFLTAEECMTFGFASKIIKNTDTEKTPENSTKTSILNKYSTVVQANSDVNKSTQVINNEKVSLLNRFRKVE